MTRFDGRFRRFRKPALCAGALVCAVLVALPAAAQSGRGDGERWRSGYAAIVVDANTGRTLHEANADEIRHPASLTKIMTLYLLFEQLEAGRLKLDSELDVSARAASQAPSKLGLRPGTTIEVEDAIKALVTKSANDVAVVIAEAVGGSEAAFASAMTRKARALGMASSVFRNASGLPDREQVTTARDLALLGRAIQDRFPRYYRFFSTRSFTWRGSTMANHNRLLGRVEGVDGIKTGYTRASGFNLVTSAKVGQRQIVAVVLGGRSGGSRDERMEDLVEDFLPRAFAGRRTAPLAVEAGLQPAPAPGQRVAPAPRPAVAEAVAPSSAPAGTPLRLDPPGAPEASGTFATAAIARPAAGSTEPLRPNAVRSVPVGPVSPQAPLGTLAPRPGQIAVAAPPAPAQPLPAPRPGQIAAPHGAGLPISPVPIQSAPMPNTLDAQAYAIRSGQSQAAPAPVGPIAVAQVAPPQPAAVAPQTAARTPAPQAPSPPAPSNGALRGEWLIQIGAFPEEGQARDRLKEAQTRARVVLGAADPFTEKVVKGSTALYRARFAGLDEDRAREACRVLKRSDFACMAVRN